MHGRGYGEWFFRTPEVNALLEALHNQGMDKLDDEDDETESEVVVAKKPARKPRQRRVKSSGCNVSA